MVLEEAAEQLDVNNNNSLAPESEENTMHRDPNGWKLLKEDKLHMNYNDTIENFMFNTIKKEFKVIVDNVAEKLKIKDPLMIEENVLASILFTCFVKPLLIPFANAINASTTD